MHSAQVAVRLPLPDSKGVGYALSCAAVMKKAPFMRQRRAAAAVYGLLARPPATVTAPTGHPALLQRARRGRKHTLEKESAMGAQWKAKHKDLAANAKGRLFGKLAKEIM